MKLCGLSGAEAYERYRTELGEDVDEAVWKQYFPGAAVFLSTETCGRSEAEQPDGITERCLLAAGSIIRRMAEAASPGGGVIAESNDGVSVTYASGKDTRTAEEKYHGICGACLAGTGLLYRGIPRREG